MATFEPPPTWAPVTLRDEKTGEETFNPVWLRWFLALVAVINASGGGGGTVTHNSLAGLQGGTANQFYHLSQADFNALTGLSGVATLFAATINGGRLQEKQGAAVASANNLTLGTDGNYFQITGATQINLLSSVSWQGGSIARLKFNSTPTIKHNQATSGNFKPILLNSGVDVTAAIGSTLALEYDSTDSAWYELARKA